MVVEQRDGDTDDIEQLADVAGPGVALDGAEGRRKGEASSRVALSAAAVYRYYRTMSAGPQRRQRDAAPFETIVSAILAEGAAGDQTRSLRWVATREISGWIAVGWRQRVTQRPGAPQQAGLGHQRHVADFVEEERAAVRPLDLARPRSSCGRR